MAISLVSTVSGALGTNGGTTAAINTTGASLIAVSVSWSAILGGTLGAVTDSKGNTYSGLTRRTTGTESAIHQWFYCLAPSVGTGHTVSVTGGSFDPVVVVYAFAGVGAYRAESGATMASGASLATGPVTPSENGALLLTGVCGRYASSTHTVAPAGFTVTSHFGGFLNLQGSAAYALQPTIAAIDPTWTFSPAHAAAAAGTVVFQATPAPAPSLTVVQTASGTASAAFATPPPVGHGVVVVIAAGATVTPGITDSAGQTYSLAHAQVGAGGGSSNRTDLYYCPVLTATATPFTVTATGGVGAMVILDIAGVGEGLAVEATAGAEGGAASSAAGPTAALTADDVLMVASVVLSSASGALVVVPGPPPVWAQRFEGGSPFLEVDTRSAVWQLGLPASVQWSHGFGTGFVTALAVFSATGTPPPDADPVYVVTIGEVEVNPILATFRIQETIDAPDTLIADVESAGAPFFRAAVGQSVFVTEDGVRIFGGSVTGVREQGFSGPNGDDLVVEIQATSYEINASRRVVTAAFSQGTPETIGAAFAALVTTYYAAIGVSLHPDQVAGPLLPAATFTRERGDAVNKQLAASVGYLQSIDFENRLRAWAPGDIRAPADYDEDTNPELFTGDIQVERQLQNGYANRVILVGDPITIPDYEDHFVGDGVTDTWPVTYQVAGPIPYVPDGAVGFAIVWFPSGLDGASGTWSESIAGAEAPPDFLWLYDPIAQTIHRRSGPVAAGVPFFFPYHGLFIPAGMAEDAAEIALYGLWEHVEEVTAVTTTLSAQAYAEALLAEKLASKEEIATLQTRALGYHPGQTITIAAPSRLLAGDYLISQVDTGAEGGVRLLRSITAAKSQNNNHDWRRVYQQWAGASAGEGSSGPSSTTSGGGAGSGLHAGNHMSGGIDAIPLDTLAPPNDTVVLDVSTARHGLAPKITGADGDVLTKAGAAAVWAPSDPGVYDAPLTDGDPTEASLICADGQCIIVQVPQ